jgi:hypothetical protein
MGQETEMSRFGFRSTGFPIAFTDSTGRAAMLADSLTRLDNRPGTRHTLGEWCIAYHSHQARAFWTFRPGGWESCTDPDQLAARLETSRHRFGLIGGRLSR